jgi:phage gp16-like protein
MPTKAQIQIVQIARRQVQLNEPQYRMLLANVAGVQSTKDLTNEDVERVMDVMEGMGFEDSKHGAGYWGRKAARIGFAANDRMIRKIETMAAETKYPLAALVHRFSSKRTDQVQQLLPREAWQLIEALKAIIAREGSIQPDLGPMHPGPIDLDKAVEECPF